MERKVKGQRQNDNGGKYDRGWGDIVKIVIAIMVGGGVGSGGTSYLSSDNAVLREKIITHITSPAIHESPAQKEIRVRTIFDREIKPYLEAIQKDIDEIKTELRENKRKR